MKKIFIFVMSIITLFGCTPSQKETVDPHFEIYNQIKETLMTSSLFEDNYPFDVRVLWNEHQDGYRYDIIIDNATVDMYNIIAMTYANENQKQMCPTIGIFDENPFHLKPGVIDKMNGFYKGIQLSGTARKKQNIKLYIEYNQDEKKSDTVKKIIEVKCYEVR